MWAYNAYGLHFLSEVELPYRPAVESEVACVTIRFGTVPKTLDHVFAARRNWQASKDAFLLTVAGAGRILVTRGQSIVIDRFQGGSLEVLCLHIMGSCTAALLQQRELFPLHASAISTQHGVIAFAGKSGYGKSTLLAEFLAQGHEAVTDDILALKQDGSGDMLAFPSYARQKLMSDQLHRGAASTNALGPVSPEGRKIYVQVPRLSTTGQRLAAVFLLQPHTAECALHRCPPIEAASLLTVATYRRQIYYGLELGTHHLQTVKRLAETVPMYRLSRQFGEDCAATLYDMVCARAACDLAAKAAG